MEQPYYEGVDLALAEKLGELGDEAALGYIGLQAGCTGLQARSLQSLGTRRPWRMGRQ